ncbi:hypothetical protein N8314_00665 [Akkermansiaceae bacterium]|nr:hypothetical protein [Akkermansiaceae bacterium]
MNRYQQALAPTHTEVAGLGLHKDTSVVLIMARTRVGGVANSAAIQGVQDGAEFYQFPESAQRLSVASNSPLDTAGGIGCTKIIIQGLDQNYKDIIEFVITNGETPVLTTQTFLRVQTATIIDAGSAKVNVGDIAINMEITNERVGLISAGLGRSVVGNYTVPDSKKFLIRSVYVSTSKGDETEVYYTQRNFGNTAYLSTPAGIIYDSFGQINDVELALPPKCDFSLTMNPVVQSPHLIVSVIGNLYSVDDNQLTN